MIRIELSLGNGGILHDIRMSGHAGGWRKGRNIVCASASFLVRTFARYLEQTPGAKVSGGAGREGLLVLKLESYPEEAAQRLAGVTGLLLLGFADLEREYPGRVQTEIRDLNRKGDYDGT